jgi:hypothetical protein
MEKRMLFCALLMLMSCFTVVAQPAPQSQTLWYESKGCGLPQSVGEVQQADL